MMRLVYLLSGAVFGWILHQAQVTDYDKIVNMFLLRDLHLMGVMGAAIATAALGLWLLRRRAKGAALGGPIEVKPKPMRPWLLAAGALFGVGWALTGT